LAHVAVTRRLPGTALDRLSDAHEVELWLGKDPPSATRLRRLVADADALLCTLEDRVDSRLLGAAKGLRAIANYAVGVDNVDVKAATKRGILVGNTPDVLTDSTADLAVALMLAVMRRLPEGEEHVRSGAWGAWRPDLLLGRDLHGATVGIVGYGRIGRAVARRLKGFEVELLHTGGRGGVPLEQLLPRADVVSLHVPLTPETRGLIGARALTRMRDDAYLVNTARGPIVETDALARALHDGAIAGAALDVTDPEPLPADHPLLDAPNLIVIPHLGSATHRTRAAMADLAVDNLLAALSGEKMPHCVNPELYTKSATRPAP
jgi:lactate dehydrogenase-like 2-hydroxyacid dehydrogenase